MPVHNAVRCTQAFLESLRETTADDAARVIVVDNGSTDETAVLLAQQRHLHVIRNQMNRGFAAAVNQGLAEATSELVCVVNNDVVFTPGWLERLTAHLDAAQPARAIVVPSTNFAAGTQRVEVGAYRDVAEMRQRARQFTDRYAGQVEDVSFVVGLCLLAPRSTFQAIGALDERFGIGNYEDNDFCVRARRLGCRLLVARDVFLHHEGSQTFKAMGVDYAALMEENRQIFLRKWGADPVLNAIARSRLGQPREAMVALAAAHDVAPACPDVLLHFAIASQAAGQWRESIEWVDRFLALCPRSKDALLVKAHALLSTRCPDQALQVLQEVERRFYLAPAGRREVLHTMATICRGRGHRGDAVRLLKLAAATGAATPQLYLDLVETAAATGDQTTYAEAVATVAQVDESNVALQLEAGHAWRLAGHHASARACYERALLLDPGSAEAQAALRQMGATPALTK
ncbi:MAG: glycosyltransferase [Planctomycetota bacterium]